MLTEHLALLLSELRVEHIPHSIIEDVERGAELSFSGPLRGVRFADPPLHHPIVKFCFLPTKFFAKIFWFGFRQDRQTDRQTDAISMFWAFLVLRPRTANGSVFATQSVAFGLDFVLACS